MLSSRTLGGVAVNSAYSWQPLYERTMLETDSSRLPALVRAARAAIATRIEELHSDSHDSSEERQAIADALTGLRVLKVEFDSSCRVDTPAPSDPARS